MPKSLWPFQSLIPVSSTCTHLWHIHIQPPGRTWSPSDKTVCCGRIWSACCMTDVQSSPCPAPKSHPCCIQCFRSLSWHSVRVPYAHTELEWWRQLHLPHSLGWMSPIRNIHECWYLQASKRWSNRRFWLSHSPRPSYRQLTQEWNYLRT